MTTTKQQVCMGLDCHKRESCQLFLRIEENDSEFIVPDADFGPDESIVRCRSFEKAEEK
jgi:hypothetical protein